MARVIAALVLLGVTLAGATAQEDMVIDQTKLYVSDPNACQAVEKQGVDAWMDMDFLSLTFPGGIQSMEFHCSFYDIKSRPNTPLLFVDAVCELPGELYPDTLAIAPYDDKTIQVVSSYDGVMQATGILPPPGPTTNPGVTMYTRCDNLSEVPVE
nr:hypothetical protein [uncultured Devosia sp.]